MAKTSPKEFAFVAPSGEIHRGTNIRKFAREKGLDPGCLQHVHLGERQHHKGWWSVYENDGDQITINGESNV